jgi:hypothetical protein
MSNQGGYDYEDGGFENPVDESSIDAVHSKITIDPIM